MCHTAIRGCYVVDGTIFLYGEVHNALSLSLYLTK